MIVTSLFFLMPFFVLMLGMFAYGYTPQYAACLAIIVGAFLLLFDGNFHFDLVRAGRHCAMAFINAARQDAMIASIILCASIVIGVLGVTGLGIKITSLILSGSRKGDPPLCRGAM